MIKIDPLILFHHIHHDNNNHKVHHCGDKHVNINPNLDYVIKHCSCFKHSINKKYAKGHDFEMNEVLVEFIEKCPKGGYHIESGIIYQKLKKENDC